MLHLREALFKKHRRIKVCELKYIYVVTINESQEVVDLLLSRNYKLPYLTRVMMINCRN